MKMNKKDAGIRKPSVPGNKIPAWRRFLVLVLAVLMVLQLAACGGKEDNGDEPQVAEWVWVPQYLSVGEDNMYYEAKLVGGDICYVSSEWDQETEIVTTSLNTYSLTDGTQTSKTLVWQEGAENNGLNRPAFGKDGSVWGIAYVSSEEPNEEGWYDSTPYLCKFDEEGNQVLFQNLSERINEDSENSYVGTMALDGQGRLYIASDKLVWLYDEQGNYVGKVSLDGGAHTWIQSMGCGKDGRMFICYYSSGDMSGEYVLAELDFNNKKVGEPCSGFPGGSGFGPGLEKDLLIYDSSKVYEYDVASQTTEELFRWLDCDINGSYVNSITSLEDGRIAVVVRDWENDDNGITMLTKTSADQVVQKETIVIATMSNAYGIQSAAVKFNKKSDKYRITIKEYFSYDYDNYTQDSYQAAWSDALTRLNNDITSDNCPDIIDLSSVNYKQLADKGVFEDLGIHLDESSVINRSDFMENILNAYTYDGTLITIPTSFYLQTVVGRAADVGTDAGWTLDEIIAYADAHPDAELFDGAQKNTIMAYMMMFNQDTFIDWSAGECKFDSDEFKKLLEFVNRFPDEWEYDSDAPSTPKKIQNGDVLLDTAYISDFNDIQIYEAAFGGPYTFIGFPTLDGSNGCAFSSSNLYALTAGSAHKEGAWAFMEQLLTEGSNRFSWGFPTIKSKLDEVIEEAVRTYYVDENGDPLLDENGEIILRNEGTSSISYGDGWSYTYHIVTQEEVDKVLELMETAKPLSGNIGDNEITSIINEEAEAFYKGQKSVDEVARVIQSRIQMYVSTNS